jgi:hypothetical protein
MAVPAEVASHLLTQVATVYARGAGGGWTVVAKTGLACRMLHLNTQDIPTGAERDQLAASRRFVWDPTYNLPQYCQIEVEGLRWNPTSNNAFETIDWADGTPAYKRVRVIRAGGA